MDPIKLLIELTLRNEKDIDEHLMTLFSLVISLKPKRIVELGVRTARSTLAFLIASQYTNSSLTSVDVDDMKPDFIFPDEVKGNWQFIKKDALQFLERDFQILMADRKPEEPLIVYIDDWHDGIHVQKEIELVEDYVLPGDLIILHDLMYGNSQPHYKSEQDPNVWEYVTIPRCNGLTILRKKSDHIVTE